MADGAGDAEGPAVCGEVGEEFCGEFGVEGDFGGEDGDVSGFCAVFDEAADFFGTTAIEPTVTLTGGVGTVLGTTRTAVSGTTWTMQTPLTGLKYATTYDVKIEYGGASHHRSFSTAGIFLDTPTLIGTTPNSVTVQINVQGDITEDVRIRYGTSSTRGDNNQFVTASLTDAATGTYVATITGLDQIKTYYFWGAVSTFNTAERGYLRASPTPYSLSDLAASAVTQTSAQITFNLANVRSGATAHVIYASDDESPRVFVPAIRDDQGSTGYTANLDGLSPGTDYHVWAEYNGFSYGTILFTTLAAAVPVITITSPADSATGISTSPLVIWTIDNIPAGTPALNPTVTLTGGAGEAIGTTQTAESGTTRTMQTALRSLAPNTRYTLSIAYGGSTQTVSFTTAPVIVPPPVTLNAPVLLSGTATETGAAFLITVENAEDGLGAVFLLYSTRNDAGNATAVPAVPGTTQTSTVRGYNIALSDLEPATRYYLWSWIDGMDPVPYAGTFQTLTTDLKIDTRFTGLTAGASAPLALSGGSSSTGITWTSDNPSVIEIDKYDGTITARKAGKAQITVTGTRPDGSITTASLLITVKAADPLTTTGWNAETPLTVTRTFAGDHEGTLIPEITRSGATAPLSITSVSAAYTTKGNTILITSPAAGATHTAVFTGRKLGDVTGDNTVNSVDALKIARYVAELENLDDTAIVYADVNGIRGPTTVDALAILEYLAGIRNADYQYL